MFQRSPKIASVRFRTGENKSGHDFKGVIVDLISDLKRLLAEVDGTGEIAGRPGTARHRSGHMTLPTPIGKSFGNSLSLKQIRSTVFVVADGHACPADRQTQTNVQLVPPIAFGKLGGGLQSALEACQCLPACASLQGIKSSLRLVFTRQWPHLCPAVVSANDRAVWPEIGRIHGFHRLSDPAVEEDTPRSKEAAVRHFADTIVNEVEAPLGLAQDTAPYQLFKTVCHFRRRQVRHVAEHGHVEIPANHRSSVDQTDGHVSEVNEITGGQGANLVRELP
jgi:hypothetical protein